ncbi:MAG: PAS domain S-box protein [Epsilonproteobacteria bacterium]|nr:MAG: PAS domain S-box protein [Campylobacterota bacterium]
MDKMMTNIETIIEECRNLRLLYVEDDVVARESIQMVLEEFFENISVAVDGSDGLEKYKNGDFDLIITDINMPRMNGLEMIEQIRKRDKHISILILSAYTESEYFVTGIKLGVDGYLLKPFDMEQFIGVLGNVIVKVQFQKAQEKLIEHHAYLQSIIDGVEDPIMVIREDYTIELMNSNLQKNIDAKLVADIKHPKCYEISHHRSTPCEGDEHPCPLQQVLESQKHTTVVHNHIDIDGSLRYVELAASPLFDNEHNCIGIIESVRDITAHLDVQDKLRKQKDVLTHQAHHDYLTGLPNRVLFHERLFQAVKKTARRQDAFALFFIDLDRFKQINDSLGHKVGDEVLQITADRLNSIIRKEDTLARLGGDEFTILMGKLNEPQDASRMAQKILDILAKPIHIADHILYISSSIGISLYPEDDTDAHNLLKYADTAMYKAKDAGKNNFQFYSAEMTAVALERIVMEASLRQALEKEEFVLFYQAKFNGENGQLTGIEALVRWQHPSRGLISPDQFIAIAEETGLIIPLDRWVMKTAMRQVVRWYDMGFNPETLALNITMKQLHQKDFLLYLDTMLQESGLKSKWLEFEITEGQIMVDSDKVITILQQISDRGIELSIDDFGTGYSSLSYLKYFPIDKLKIDQSFIENLPDDEDDAGIARAVIALAKSLNLKVIAEGVENEAQKKFLIENGCQNMQGYLYGKPMPSKEMETILTEMMG